MAFQYFHPKYIYIFRMKNYYYLKCTTNKNVQLLLFVINRKYIIPPGICTDKRLSPTSLSSDEKSKHSYYVQNYDIEVIMQFTQC